MLGGQQRSTWLQSVPEDSEGPRVVVENPATGEDLLRLAEAGPEAVDAAARAAQAAFEGDWGDVTAAERGRTLLGLAAHSPLSHDAPRRRRHHGGAARHSGIGREKGLEALRHYTQVKTVIAHVDAAP
jgi:acyl-CoA reductase-like NAD-dependent aldehyde dehydrogenase